MTPLYFEIHPIDACERKREKTKKRYFVPGAGESGKSTVLKQMRLLHAAGFSASERESYRVIVFSNIFSIMQTLLEITQQLDLEIHDKQLQVPYEIT